MSSCQFSDFFRDRGVVIERGEEFGAVTYGIDRDESSCMAV